MQFNIRAMEELRNGSFEKAYSLLKQADSLDKYSVVTLNNIGCYYKRMNKPAVALHYYKKAVALFKASPSDPANLAGVYLNICTVLSLLTDCLLYTSDAADE